MNSYKIWILSTLSAMNTMGELVVELRTSLPSNKD
jgi:hypothetical protein